MAAIGQAAGGGLIAVNPFLDCHSSHRAAFHALKRGPPRRTTLACSQLIAGDCTSFAKFIQMFA